MVRWLLCCRHKIVIAGNHDVTIHEAFYEKYWQKFHYRSKLDDAEARRTLGAQDNDSFTYLEDSAMAVLGCSQAQLITSATLVQNGAKNCVLQPGTFRSRIQNKKVEPRFIYD